MLRKAIAEFIGAALLVAVVVGSGIAAQRLSPTDVGLQLLENSIATTLGLSVLIIMFGPVSGAHFNPVVTLADWALGRRSGAGLPLRDVGPYIAAQVSGAIGGAVLANAMFGAGMHLSGQRRSSGGHLLGEVVATAGLLLLIFALVRTRRTALVAPAVGAYIGAAYWFASSTSFANPAVTVGRIFSDTFAGIAPGSAVGFIAMQIVGLIVAIPLILVLYPTTTQQGDDALMPHDPAPAPPAERPRKQVQP